MTLKDWFANRSARTEVKGATFRRDIPDGLWVKCTACEEALFTKELQSNLQVCPRCGFHFRLNARERIEQLVDEGSFETMDAHLRSTDPLAFVDTKRYSERLKDAYAKHGPEEGVITGIATIDGQRVALGVMNFYFLGGSMGSVVGEKITRLIERAGDEQLPLITVTASGGARMQEGALSLMQMAKTTAALQHFHRARKVYIAVMADPTTGGVTASFPSLADILVSEPGALIGFAGRRVIEQTIRQKPPADFQMAESLLRHGLIDMIIPRPKLKGELSRLLKLHRLVDVTSNEGAVSHG
ncbi:MAG: acetyl-CoA carboxylase, carboxyltransferase subunit beta [Candidatus Sericytochromatia bacterium]|nr:acetyl-CoA carboxylase, carboxyltransferase subunit beta [Candidatus Sericytochromatia bacterium]